MTEPDAIIAAATITAAATLLIGGLSLRRKHSTSVNSPQVEKELKEIRVALSQLANAPSGAKSDLRELTAAVNRIEQAPPVTAQSDSLIHELKKIRRVFYLQAVILLVAASAPEWYQLSSSSSFNAKFGFVGFLVIFVLSLI